MIIKSEPLPENVYPYPAMPPVKDDSNEKGYVLWFHPVHGWTQGWWRGPTFTGSTHWTYCPPAPPEQESQQAKSDRLFDDWIRTFDHNFDEITRSLIKMGWDGAVKKGQLLP